MKRLIINGVIKPFFVANCVFAILFGGIPLHIPILDGALFLLTGSQEPQSLDRQLLVLLIGYIIVVPMITLCGFMMAWGYYRAISSEEWFQKVLGGLTRIYHNKEFWDKYREEYLVPQLNREEAAGELRFPPYKDRKKMGMQEYVFRMFVANRALEMMEKTPDKIPYQKHLKESKKYI